MLLYLISYSKYIHFGFKCVNLISLPVFLLFFSLWIFFTAQDKCFATKINSRTPLYRKKCHLLLFLFFFLAIFFSCLCVIYRNSLYFFVEPKLLKRFRSHPAKKNKLSKKRKPRITLSFKLISTLFFSTGALRIYTYFYIFSIGFIYKLRHELK